jgi:hypothetical protein
MIVNLQAKQIVEGKELDTVDRYEVYAEKEMTSTADKKVMVKELVGVFTESEIRADIANLENEIADKQNQLRDKNALLEQIVVK